MVDADSQHRVGDVPALVRPIVEGRADILMGDRQTDGIEHISPLERPLQRSRARERADESVPSTGARPWTREAQSGSR